MTQAPVDASAAGGVPRPVLASGANAALQSDPRERSSRSRNRASPRLERVRTVEAAKPRRAAVSATVCCSSQRCTTTSRYADGRASHLTNELALQLGALDQLGGRGHRRFGARRSRFARAPRAARAPDVLGAVREDAR